MAQRDSNAAAASGVPLLWVSHDFAQVRRVADHVLVVLDGRIAHSAGLDDVLDGAPDCVRRFLEEAEGDD